MPAAYRSLRPFQFTRRSRRLQLLAKATPERLRPFAFFAAGTLPEDPADPRRRRLPAPSDAADRARLPGGLAAPVRSRVRRDARAARGARSDARGLARGSSSSSPRLSGDRSALASPAAVHGLKLPSFDSNFNLEPGPHRGLRKIQIMHARKISVPLFAFALGLTLAGFASAAPEAPAVAPAVAPAAGETPPAAEKACCQHHEATGDKSGMHCDHAKMKTAGEEGKACCAKHASMHQEGAAAEGKAACAKHVDMMKGAGSADTKACCAQHAEMMKDGAKGCCCCDGGEACPHHAVAEAPAKS